MPIPSTTDPVANPTWYGDIRYLFTSTDIAHMKNASPTLHLDLSSYESVQKHAYIIYGQVALGDMPPSSPWPQAWVSTFVNWMKSGYPKGGPKDTAVMAALRAVSNAPRIRKEIRDLSQSEINTLKKAFQGIKDLPIDNPNSYFVQAGYHWLPEPNTYCLHHVPGYNPWHRAYMLSFENALRSIKGCEDVTLPYWDITKWDKTKQLPAMLKEPPFDSYILPEDIGGNYTKGYKTFRAPDEQIYQNLLTHSVTDDINRALGHTDWTDFHGFWSGARYNTIIAAHDAGHDSIGGFGTNPGTMSDQDVASFDPIFWFFHSNWDRLFWKWQKQMDATTIPGLLSTIDASVDPVSYQMFTDMTSIPQTPFKNTIGSIVDSANSLGVDYQEPKSKSVAAVNFVPKTLSTLSASKMVSVKTSHVNVHVEGLNRLKIPGSFSVHLLKDGERIASKGFFQPNEVHKCENCVENAIVHFDFELPLDAVSKGRLSVEVEPRNKNFVGNSIPHKLIGDPTIEVQLLMQTE